MATTKTIQATVKNRTDTVTNWTQKNPVLTEGEIVVVQMNTGETRLKIGDGTKTFTQLPYADEQIYNNVVTSVNGQTGNITMNSVEYTPQTLTDVQKKQARDNMDAASNDFIINVTSTDDINCTLDKTFDQIQEAVQAGKKVYTKLNGIFTIYMPMVLYSPFAIVFAATAFISESIEQYVLAVPKDNSNGNNPQFIKKLAVTYDSDSTMKQVYMNEDPVNDMQIATKKYVDDSLDYGADLEMSDTSTHPVRNMVIKKYVDDALGSKAGTDVVTESANGLMSKEDKTKLDGIAAAAKGTFYVTVTQGNNNGATADKTPAEVYAAYEEGYAVYALVKFRDYDDPFILSLAYAVNNSEDLALGFAATGSTGVNSRPQCMSVLSYFGLWIAWRSTLAWKEDIPAIPTELKNPNALTIKIGSTTVTYDGSEAQTVTIDDGGNITVDAELNAASTNPVQNKTIKAALDGKLSTTGGTLTGNLTGKYITGTWLQSTAATDLGKTPGKIAVLDDHGWVYYRTPSEILNDIGGGAGGAGVTVDTEMSDTSTNAVQNKVIKKYVDDHSTGGGFKYFTYNASAGSANMTPAEVKAFIAANPNVPVYMKITNLGTNAPDEWGVLQGPRSADGVLTFVATEFAAKGGSQRYIAVTSASDTAWSTTSNQYLVTERRPSLYAPSFYSDAGTPAFGITEDSIIGNANGPFMSVMDDTLNNQDFVSLGLENMFFETGTWASIDEIYKYVGRGSILCDIDFALGHVTLIGDVEGAITGYNTDVYNQIRQEIDYERGNIWLKIDFNRTGEHIRLSSWNKSGSTYKLVFFGAGNGATPVKYEVTASESSASLTVTGS